MAQRGRKSIANERRAQILDAFHICSVRKGLERASLREVAEEAGLPVSNLHHFFKNRDEMVNALVKRIVGGIIDDLKAELQAESDPRKRFRKGIDSLFSPNVQKLEDGSLYYDSWSLAHRSETVRKTFREQIRNQRSTIADILRETPKFKNLSETDMEDIANIMISLVEGAFYILDMDGENVSPKRMARLTRRFLELYADERVQKRNKKNFIP